jgi:SAM-dependent methyltransferase
MPVFNLLGSLPNVKRNLSARLVNKQANRILANKFGQEYFDGSREQGYGGYIYDGRWQKVARTAKDRYFLASGMSVLDIGCAKGFFVGDLMQEIPGLKAVGIDVSGYALTKAKKDIQGYLYLSSADKLPFPDNSFDAVFAINTLHNLDRDSCIKALREINRVAKFPEKTFVQVDAYHSLKDRALFEDWMLTAKTYCTPDEWLSLFDEAGYIGDFFWTTFDFTT